MDLNYLLGRHQQSLINAAGAATPGAAAAHRGLVERYAGCIRRLQCELGATARLVEAQPAPR